MMMKSAVQITEDTQEAEQDLGEVLAAGDARDSVDDEGEKDPW